MVKENSFLISILMLTKLNICLIFFLNPFFLFCQKQDVLYYFDIVYKNAKKTYFGNQEPEFLSKDLDNQYLKVKSRLGTIQFMTWQSKHSENVVIVEIIEKCSYVCAQRVNVMVYNGQNFSECKKYVFPLENIESAVNYYLPYIAKQFDYYEFWYEYIPSTRGFTVGYRVNIHEEFKMLPLVEIQFDGDIFVVSKYYDPPPYLEFPANKKRFQPKESK